MEARGDVSGMLYIRNGPADAPDGSGRRLVVVFGVIAVGDEFVPKGEHQYPVVGTIDGLHLVLAEGREVQIPDSGAWRVDQLLTEKIWQV